MDKIEAVPDGHHRGMSSTYRWIHQNDEVLAGALRYAAVMEARRSALVILNEDLSYSNVFCDLRSFQFPEEKKNCQ